MKTKSLVSRFILPRHLISLYYFLKFRCIISPRAEVEFTKNLTIGKKSQISSFVKMKASDGILKLGERVDIATGCFLSSGKGGLEIGNDCLVGPNCIILSGEYKSSKLNMTFREQGHTSKGTIIGNNVLIGAGSVILDGSRIDDGVIIGANSLVSGKIAKNSIAQGNPAKVIFTRR